MFKRLLCQKFLSQKLCRRKHFLTPFNKDLERQLQQNLQANQIVLDTSQQQAIQAMIALLDSERYLGVMLWGGVGTGKTLIMNRFYECFQGPKVRYHSHQLYQQLMQQMFCSKSDSQPLKKALKSLSRPAGIVCLDDFYLRDIADAKLWQGIFEYWLAKHQKLLLTSNQKPSQIMLNAPSYRQQIQQLIEAMDKHLHLVEVDTGQDYRQLNINAYKKSHYALIAPGLYDSILGSLEQATEQQITVQKRALKIVAKDQNLVVLDFNLAFNTARSYNDYLELSQRFEVIALVNYSKGLFSNASNLQRLVWFVDVVYDNQTKLFWFIKTMPWQEIEASENPEVKRCLSRLRQMFSKQHESLKKSDLSV